MTSFALPTIPGEFQWRIPPVDWSYEPTKGLYISAGAKTDLFFDPSGEYVKDNAPCALVALSGDNFLFSTKVTVEFGSTFDAGCLQIRESDDKWAKLCFEYSPQHRPMIVSVVTRGVSDDCNSAVINSSEIYLRVARTPKTLAFHYSYDGHFWHFIRYFSLGELSSLRVGFSTQSPLGPKCAAVFSDINFTRESLKDIRNGE